MTCGVLLLLNILARRGIIVCKINGSFSRSSLSFLRFIYFEFFFMIWKWCLKLLVHILMCLSCMWEKPSLLEIQSVFLNKLWGGRAYYIQIVFMLCGIYWWATTFLLFFYSLLVLKLVSLLACKSVKHLAIGVC